MRLVFALALVVGCKSTSIPTEETGSPTTCEPQSWYPDADGDGAGDADATAVEACEAPDAHVADATDCDDDDADIGPDSVEQCDAIDNNCDGSVDEGVLITFFPDADEDGVGAEGPGVEACEAPAGHVETTGDCDDDDIYVSPDQPESCDSLDNDCDGDIDEGVLTAFYEDIDGDGFGDPATEVMACQAPQGHITDNTDCDDQEPASAPGLTEICDAVDNNCDGDIDEGVLTAFYEDVDEDGFGDPATEVMACEAPISHVTDNTDCDDLEPARAPGLTEVCDELDNNCDGSVDEGVLTAFYEDVDEDGFGDPTTEVMACEAPISHVTDNTDCDDLEPARSPGLIEVCDELDNNCDGSVDEGVQTAFYEDVDADGFGDITTEVLACEAPADHITDSTDCDDTNDEIYPGAPSRCDDLDTNCSGGIEELRVPEDFPFGMQDALDVAVDGDHICLDAGTHVGTWDLGSLAIIIEGDDTGAWLDASDNGRVLRTDGSPGLELRNLTLKAGYAQEGAALRAQGSTVTMTDIIVENNSCFGTCKGAGLYFRNASVDMTDVVVQNNTFSGTDTELIEGVGMFARNTTITGERVDFLGNQAFAAQYIDGVGFCQHGGTTVFHDAVFNDNDGDGGTQPRGAAVRVYQGDFEAVDALVQNNNMVGDSTTGGPLTFVSSGSSRLENVLVTGNTTVSGNAAFGGGLYLFGHTLEIEQSTFTDNHVDGATQSFGLSAYMFPSSTLDVTNTDFSGNTGTNAVVGQVVVQSSTFIGAYSNFFPDSFHLDDSPVGSDGNISVDPAYNAAYEPTAGLIDVGDPDILDADGTRSDIGYVGP